MENFNSDEHEKNVSNNLFLYYDKDHNNEIDFEEFKYLAADFNFKDETKLRKAFDQIDEDSSGSISSSELVAYCSVIIYNKYSN
jgi:Ca2+-binding EF-hand superfamily protein